MGKVLSAKAERALNYAELVLRFLVLGLALLTVISLVMAKQTVQLLGLNIRASFTNTQATILLVIVYAHASGYTLLQCVNGLLNCCFLESQIQKSKLITSASYICDLGLACIGVAAMAAAVQAGMLSKKGVATFGWIPVCDYVGRYCDEALPGIVGSVLGAVCLFLLSLISSFRYFRLLGADAAPSAAAAVSCMSPRTQANNATVERTLPKP